MIDEGVGNRIAHRETFDGLDIFALRVDRQDAATVDNLARHDHGAGAAGAAIANFLRAGQVQIIPHGIEQRDPRLDRQIDGFSVEVESDCHRPGAGHIGRGRNRFFFQ